ncbi:MAG: ornithine carbamoyltransferase [archaeon]|nr:ornithine carbamoyltransferase [archaeon]
MKKDFINDWDLSQKEMLQILKLAKELKAKQKKGKEHKLLKGKQLAMIFEKPSTRTRISFEVGMNQLGGNALYLAPDQMQIGRGETISDTAKVLSRYVDLIMARVFKHETVQELANNATVPVINGLSDLLHPCQALSDMLTISEHSKKFKGTNLAYLGAANNVSNSLMLTSSILGMNFYLFSPKEFPADQKIYSKAKDFAKKTNSIIEINTSITSNIAEMDFLYTDVWISMGQNLEKEKIIPILKPFQINSQLLVKAKNAKAMHCLPAHRGEEITNEAIDGKQSIVFQQAENRLHTQKALMAFLLKQRK